MRKDTKVYLGDKVVTTKHFRPEMVNGSVYDLKGEDLEGVVVQKRFDYYGIDFGKEYPFTHRLEDSLNERTGYALHAREFKVTETYKNKDKKKEGFVSLLQEQHYVEKQELPKELGNRRTTAEQKKSDLASIARQAKQLEKELLKINFEMNSIRERMSKADVLDIKYLERLYDKMLKSKYIKNVETIADDVGNAILVTTENLTYTSERHPSFDLGAYKILIPTDARSGGNLSIVNYKKHVSKEYHHPCVRFGSAPCFGSDVGNQVSKHLAMKDYIPLVYTIIDFLKEPDYRGPYIEAKDFAGALPVSIQPRNPRNWFDRSYWEEHEMWDSTLYSEKMGEARELFSSYGE